MEAGRQLLDGIAMAHPHRQPPWQTLEEWIVGLDFDVRRAKLAFLEGGHLPAELIGHQLQSVADAQDRQLPTENARIAARRTLFVNAVRSARKDDPFGLARRDFFPGSVVRQQLAEHIAFPNAPG